jgi:hypothetical protein
MLNLFVLHDSVMHAADGETVCDDVPSQATTSTDVGEPIEETIDSDTDSDWGENELSMIDRLMAGKCKCFMLLLNTSFA